LTLPFSLNGQEIFVSASMGIAVSTTGYDKPEDVMRDADTALNRAKAQGKAGYQIFDPAMHEEAVARMKIESLLRKGLELEQSRNSTSLSCPWIRDESLVLKCWCGCSKTITR